MPAKINARSRRAPDLGLFTRLGTGPSAALITEAVGGITGSGDDPVANSRAPAAIANALEEADLVEFGASALVVYRRREGGPSA